VKIINFILNYFYINVLFIYTIYYIYIFFIVYFLFIKYTTYYCQPILRVYSILLFKLVELNLALLKSILVYLN